MPPVEYMALPILLMLFTSARSFTLLLLVVVIVPFLFLCSNISVFDVLPLSLGVLSVRFDLSQLPHVRLY